MKVQAKPIFLAISTRFMNKNLLCFFITIVCYSPTISSAQESCSCKEANTLKSRQDSIRILPNSSMSRCKAIGFELITDSLLKNKQTDEAEKYLERIEHFYKKADCDKSQKKNLIRLYIALYDLKASYNQLLEYQLQLLSLAEAENDETEIGSALLNIAQVFNRLKQADKGMEFTRKSIPLITKMKASVLKAELLNKITARYFFYAQDYNNKLYADTALLFVNTAYKTAKEVNSIKEQIIALTRLSAIAESKNEYSKALNFIDSALNMCRPGINNRQYVTLYGDKGFIYFKLNNFKEARRYADSGLKYSMEEKYPPLISNSYSLIYDIEVAAENYKEALWARDNQKKISDSLFTSERTKTVNELEKKYNQAKNERTIKELSQQKQIYLLLALAGLLALLLIGFLLHQQSLKHKQVVLETELRLNRARMNPHFFFNALASLQSLALKESNPTNIATNLSKFSHIMRETLESTYNDYITIEEEAHFLKEYLDLQQIRFPQKFKYEIQIDDNVEADELMVPSMIVQPFVENSIEHGFSNIDYTGIILVHFIKTASALQIIIKDNGKGFAPNQEEKGKHISRAGQIVRERIDLLNLKLNSKAGFQISESADKGVEVKIMLPEIYSNSK